MADKKKRTRAAPPGAPARPKGLEYAVEIPVRGNPTPDEPWMYLRRHLMEGKTAVVEAEASITVVPAEALDVPTGTLVFTATIKGRKFQAEVRIEDILQALVTRWGAEVDGG